MKNKAMLKKEISEIRELLLKNNINEAYNKLISLNTIYEDIDDYTCYFTNTIDLDVETDCEYDFEVDEVNGTIVVESVVGGYIPAKASDIEDTLQEIESKFL